MTHDPIIIKYGEVVPFNQWWLINILGMCQKHIMNGSKMFQDVRIVTSMVLNSQDRSKSADCLGSSHRWRWPPPHGRRAESATKFAQRYGGRPCQPCTERCGSSHVNKAGWLDPWYLNLNFEPGNHFRIQVKRIPVEVPKLYSYPCLGRKYLSWRCNLHQKCDENNTKKMPRWNRADQEGRPRLNADSQLFMNSLLIFETIPSNGFKRSKVGWLIARNWVHASPLKGHGMWSWPTWSFLPTRIASPEGSGYSQEIWVK